MRNKIKEIIAYQELGVKAEHIGDNVVLTEMGLDSIDIVDVISQLEEEFDIEVDVNEEAAIGQMDVNGLVKFVEMKKGPVNPYL